MSVLTRLEATPTRIAHLLSVLADRSNGETEERLREFCAPASLLNKTAQEPYTVYRSTVGAARELQLCEATDDRIRVRPDLVRRNGLVPDLVPTFEAVLLPPLLEDAPQADFARAVSWFLIQSPRRPLTLQRNYKLEIEQQLVPGSPNFDISNTDRWITFTYWCRYLGYGKALADRSMVPDPTAALRRLLPQAMREQRVLAASAFFNRLAELSPVFEQGAARREVEAMCLPHLRREDARLSQSTSFALTRLERQGFIKLDAPSDAPPLILDLGPDPSRRFSQIEFVGGR